MIRKPHPMFALVLTLMISCKSGDQFKIITEDSVRVIGNKREVIEQIVQTLRKSDNKPIAKLTRLCNYDDDIRIKYLTGLSKENGLQDYLLDSIYYDANGNDTLKESFVRIDNKWMKSQFYRKTFRADNQVQYFVTERHPEGRTMYKREIFYKYSDLGNILSETEFECSEMVSCDSLSKKLFFYNSKGAVDSTVSYVWFDKRWWDHSTWNKVYGKGR
jgi:hypothetical protein